MFYNENGLSPLELTLVEETRHHASGAGWRRVDTCGHHGRPVCRQPHPWTTCGKDARLIVP